MGSDSPRNLRPAAQPPVSCGKSPVNQASNPAPDPQTRRVQPEPAHQVRHGTPSPPVSVPARPAADAYHSNDPPILAVRRRRRASLVEATQNPNARSLRQAKRRRSIAAALATSGAGWRRFTVLARTNGHSPLVRVGRCRSARGYRQRLLCGPAPATALPHPNQGPSDPMT